jgi:outer membrane protein OmpA-like peptidoglycan-associated protein
VSNNKKIRRIWVMNTLRNSTAAIAVLAMLVTPVAGYAQDTTTSTETEAELTEAELLKKLKAAQEEAEKAAEEAEKAAEAAEAAAGEGAVEADANANADATVTADQEAALKAAEEAAKAAEKAAEAAQKEAEHAEKAAAKELERKLEIEAERAAAEAAAEAAQKEAEAAELAAQELERKLEQQAEREAAEAAAEAAQKEAEHGEKAAADELQRKLEQEAESAAAAAAAEAAEAEKNETATAEAEAAAEAAQKEAEHAEKAAADELKRKLEQESETAAAAAAAEAAEKEAELEKERAELLAQRQAERAAAAATGTGEAAEVETEAVTTENTRASNEEFDAAVQPEKRSGLSKFEKALLVGLGAVAVGQLLKNGDKVVSNSGDRVVVQGDDGLRVLKSDNELLRRPGADVRTETFDDGSTRTIVTQRDGNRVVTIAAADGRVIQRFVVRPDGTEVMLIDDTIDYDPVDTFTLRPIDRPRDTISLTDELALRTALQGRLLNDPGRKFSLAQVRDLRRVRELAPTVELDSVTFASGSAAIQPDQAEQLVALGRAIVDVIDKTPEAVILIEGHTDAVGSDAFNLALSDRRAETVALALTEYFNVPPENLITQGYGESALKVQTQLAERANRRAVVRNITPLLR